MIPVELSIMSRSAAATGPFGSSTPSEQPPSTAAPVNKMAIVPCRISDSLADQESREKHKEVQNGKREQATCRPSIDFAAHDQRQRQRDENRPADGSGRAIDRSGKSKRPWQQRNREQRYAVNKDLSRGPCPADDDRQHRDAGTGVFVGAVERQGP